MGQFNFWMKQMREDVRVPESVQERVNAVLAELPDSVQTAQNKDGSSRNKNSSGREMRNYSKFAGTAAAVVAVCALAGTATAVAAAYLQWSNGIEKRFRLSDEQKENAVEKGLAVNPALFAGENDVVSDTVDGVTVWVEQTLVDQKAATLAFKVQGVDFPEGADPEFEKVTIKIDGEDAENWAAGFYNGIAGEGVYDDGTPYEYWEGEDGSRGIVLRYQDSEGNYEYDVSLKNLGQFDTYIGKEIEICFKNLGYTTSARMENGQTSGSESRNITEIREVAYQYVSVAEGEWHLRWTLAGNMAKRHEKVNVPIGDTGVTLLEADLTPVSLRVLCRTDSFWNTNLEVDENGFPDLVGVKLCDGTVYVGIQNGGTSGYIDVEERLYEMDYATNRVFDPEEVEALLFLREIPEMERELTEEDCYVIAIE